MKRYINKHFTDILYAVCVAGMALIIFLLFMLNIKTDATVSKTHDDLVTLQKHIEADHAKQDQLLSCLVQLFTNQQSVSDSQIAVCVAHEQTGQQSRIPATDIAPARQEGNQIEAPAVGPSSSQSTREAATAQSNTSPGSGIPVIGGVVDFVSGLL